MGQPISSSELTTSSILGGMQQEKIENTKVIENEQETNIWANPPPLDLIIKLADLLKHPLRISIDS